MLGWHYHTIMTQYVLTAVIMYKEHPQRYAQTVVADGIIASKL